MGMMYVERWRGWWTYFFLGGRGAVSRCGDLVNGFTRGLPRGVRVERGGDFFRQWLSVLGVWDEGVGWRWW